MPSGWFGAVLLLHLRPCLDRSRPFGRFPSALGAVELPVCDSEWETRTFSISLRLC